MSTLGAITLAIGGLVLVCLFAFWFAVRKGEAKGAEEARREAAEDEILVIESERERRNQPGGRAAFDRLLARLRKRAEDSDA